MNQALIDGSNIESWHLRFLIEYVNQVQLDMLVEISNKPPQILTLFHLMKEIIVQDFVFVMGDHGGPSAVVIGDDFLKAGVIQFYVEVTVSTPVEVYVAVSADIGELIVVFCFVKETAAEDLLHSVDDFIAVLDQLVWIV